MLGALRYLWRSAKGGHNEKVKDLKSYLEESPLQGRERPAPGRPMDEPVEGERVVEEESESDDCEAASDPASEQEPADPGQPELDSQVEPAEVQDGGEVEGERESESDDDHANSPTLSRGCASDREGDGADDAQDAAEAAESEGEGASDPEVEVAPEGGEDASDPEVDVPEGDAEPGRALVAHPELDNADSQPGRVRGGWLGRCYAGQNAEEELLPQEQNILIDQVERYLREKGLGGCLGKCWRSQHFLSRHAMMADYKSHCASALEVYGRPAFGGLCSVDHFNVWLRAMKAKERLEI